MQIFDSRFIENVRTSAASVAIGLQLGAAGPYLYFLSYGLISRLQRGVGAFWHTVNAIHLRPTPMKDAFLRFFLSPNNKLFTAPLTLADLPLVTRLRASFAIRYCRHKSPLL